MVYDNHLIHPYHLSQPIYSIEENLSWTNLAQYSLVQPITVHHSPVQYSDPNFGYFVANLRTFWCTFTCLNNAVVYQYGQLWEWERLKDKKTKRLKNSE